jgi:hypothetical protein
MAVARQRLDYQRPPVRLHQRPNGRLYRRGYGTLPHAVWGDAYVVSSMEMMSADSLVGDDSGLPGDPGAYTIPVVEAWVTDHPDQASAVLAAEEARPTPRSTLVTWLQNLVP